MDWTALLVGAVVGAIFGLLVQNIAFPFASQWWSQRLQARRNEQINNKWTSFQGLVPNLQLRQSGWQPDGSFSPAHVRLSLVGDYKLPADLLFIRRQHEATWLAEGQTDGEQVGISALRIRRLSDDPAAARSGRSHIIEIDAHTYRYFDFLSTHRLLGQGTDTEQQHLRGYVSADNAVDPIVGFPNPLSVGLSLFCEAGKILVLVLRTTNAATGGGWHGGKIFNAVGENATPLDFAGGLNSSPVKIARRGLFEEVGLKEDESERCALSIHSLAWAIDVRDHKFFGSAVTKLTEAEVRNRWQQAHDRSENPRDIRFLDVSSRRASLNVWREMRVDSTSWSPEALFCTTRSLLQLGKLSPDDWVSTSASRVT